MKLDTLKKLYVDQIKDLHNAEQQLTKAIPNMIDACTNPSTRPCRSTSTYR